MVIMSKKTSLIILILVSIGVHFAFFGHPNETVFDEVHFGKFVSAYYTHEYYFDIHPPGGKLIIAGFSKLFNFSPEYSFAQIGQSFPDNKYLALRFLPVLAGALLSIVIYFLALELGLSAIGAFGAGMLIALENALLTQSRYILMDPFLLLFGFAGLLFYFKYRSRFYNSVLIPNSYFLIPASIFFGLSMSIKWTGIAFLGLAGVIELVTILGYGIRDKYYGVQNIFKQLPKLALYFIVIPLTLYFSIFVIHFSLLTKSGDGDAFMTPAFQSSLQGSDYANDLSIKPLNIFQKFIELNQEMYTANATLTATHPYSSKWYTWPFMIRPIYYWNHSAPTEFPGSDWDPTPRTAASGSAQIAESKIYFIGNPIIWWASTIAILYLVLSSMGDWISKFKKKPISLNIVPLILIGGYFLNYLPFVGIGRVMFLYHYLSALIFAILALAYLIDQQKNRRNILIGLIVLASLAFLYFAPLSYGLPLEAGSFQNRLWLTSWQ